MLASTLIGVTGAQSLSTELSAGFAYYIEINGYNTGDELTPGIYIAGQDQELQSFFLSID